MHPNGRALTACCCHVAQVLQKLQQPLLHNSIVSQQDRQAEDHEWKVRSCLECVLIW